MGEEYKVGSGFKCNPWAIKKLSGLQHCPFICLCHADPSAATISASHCWLLIQMYSPCLLVPGVGTPSNRVHVYSLVVPSLNKPSCLPSCPLLQIATHSKPLQGDEIGLNVFLLLAPIKPTCDIACLIVMSLDFEPVWTILNIGFVTRKLNGGAQRSNNFGDPPTFLKCNHFDNAWTLHLVSISSNLYHILTHMTFFNKGLWRLKTVFVSPSGILC